MTATRALVLALLCACSGPGTQKKPSPTPLPPRAKIAGFDLLALVPEGADAVAEIDLRRLRQNATLGTLVDRAVPSDLARGLVGMDLDGVDVLVLAVYRAGHKEAQTLFLVRGDRLEEREGRLLLDEHTAVHGPSPLCADVQLLAQGKGRSVLGPEFMALRDQAMPQGAQGASLRVTARLAHDARVAIAGRLGIDGLPRTISLWMDVVDDLALVALLEGDDADEAERLARAARAFALSPARRLVPLYGLHAETAGARTRVVWVVGPAALARWVKERLLSPRPGRY